ncbi:MAG TPA: hypothetical protein VJ732_16370 [Bryobacteraceae bacterium]|nr:hypothetical protein [Bryobacteraceae bacterium]
MNAKKSSPSKLKTGFRLLAFACFVLASSGRAADFGGFRVDRVSYHGFARSLQTGRYYPATVVFEHNHAIVDLPSNKRLDLTLEDETIEDPEEILATDGHGVWWALAVDDLDEQPTSAQPGPVTPAS